MTTSGLDEQTIFHAARRIAAPEARRLYLDQACGDDWELRSQVEALLRVHDDDKSFLESRAEKLRASITEPAGEGPGTVIGLYRLIEQLGEGGMGTVYLAEQTEPVRRQVALKIVRVGMDSRQVISRFDVERQALALMDHPNIARIIDAGESPPVATGGLSRPYFVMELVQGLPITKFCDDHHLTPKQRLELFIPVCQAIQHAHQKGIIHRDLKPTNVLVTQVDGRAIPKIIDFGVAKATAQMLTEQTLSTGLGAVVGTLEYMSPEQAGPTPHDIDTRSDIYSLGVLLYELLTGTPPFERKRFREAALQEMLRIVCEEEPPKPSTRISTAEGLPSIAANRGIEPKQLTSLLRSDLDWIVMRCLEKDRGRRYATANGLARDIERFLSDEPVEAGPPSVGYKVRKFLRRNRGPVVAASLLLLALVGGTIGTFVGMIRAQQQRELAETASAAERMALDSAKKRLVQLERGHEILGSIFEDLSPRAERTEGKSLSVLLGERLETAAKQLEGESVGDPAAVARMQRTLGKSLLHLGHTDQAIDLIGKSRSTMTKHLGAEHIETLGVSDNLALAYQTAGRLNLALPLFEETLRIARERLGPNAIDTLTYMHNLASAYRRAEKLDHAIPLFEETLRLRKATLGPTHFSTLATMNNLGVAYQFSQKLELALPLLEETLRLRKQAFGLDNSETLASINNLAAAFRAAGQMDKAIPLFIESLELHTTKLGPDHPKTILGINNLASGYDSAGKPDQAFPLYQQAVAAIEKRKFQHESSRTIVNNMSSAHEQRKEFERAEAWRRKWLAVLQDRGETDSVEYAGDLMLLAANLLQQKKWSEAESVLRDCLTIREKKEPDSWRTFSNRSLMGEAIMRQQKFTEAEPLLIEGYDGMKQREATIPNVGKRQLTKALERLIQLYEAWGKPEESEKWRKELPATKP